MKSFASLLGGEALKRVVQSLFVLGALTVSAHGQILLDDSFSGSEQLGGTKPDIVDPNNATWNVVDGNNTLGGGVDNVSSMGSSENNYIAYSGSNFVDGETYTLAMGFTLTSGNNGWIAIGIDYGSGGKGSMYDAGTNATEFANDGANSWTAFWTNGYNSNSDASGSGPSKSGLGSGVMEIQMAIGNTGAATLSYFIGPNANSLTLLNPGAPLTLTQPQVAAITGVGFAGNTDVNGTLSSFELSAPEPRTYAMMALGLGALIVAGRWRRLASRA